MDQVPAKTCKINTLALNLDVDVIILVDSSIGVATLKDNAVFRETGLFADEDKRHLLHRIEVFLNLNPGVDVLSHDFKITDTDFYIDLHFIDLSFGFEKICGSFFEGSLSEDDDCAVFMREYNCGELDRNYYFFSFTGGRVEAYEVEPTKLVEGGVVENVHAFTKVGDVYGSGRYQLIICPSFLVYWEKYDNGFIQARVDRFKSILRQRFEYERLYSKKISHMFKCHLRYPQFSPMLLANNT